MSELTSAIQNVLMPNEQLVCVVENLQCHLTFIPHMSPLGDESPFQDATLGVTNRRIIAFVLDRSRRWRRISISALNSLTERPLLGGSSWPYQAILMIPGGIALMLQTKTNDAQHANQLSSVLAQAFIQFGTRHDDDGALTAIITHEEEEERRRQAAYDDDRQKKK
jgi:hypothetical protein